MTENWLPIPGYVGRYEISDQGRVRSLLFRGHPRTEIMRPSRNYSGYHVIKIGHDRKQFRLHCLVLETFVGSRPSGMQGCHGDNNKDNNVLSNLRWDTPSGNIADRRSYDGSENPNSKLTFAQRAEIKRRRLSGEKTTNLALEFGVTTTRISQIALS